MTCEMVQTANEYATRKHHNVSAKSERPFRNDMTDECACQQHPWSVPAELSVCTRQAGTRPSQTRSRTTLRRLWGWLSGELELGEWWRRTGVSHTPGERATCSNTMPTYSTIFRYIELVGYLLRHVVDIFCCFLY
jgi:hypothetical protein